MSDCERFYKLVRIHDFIWRDKGWSLTVRIAACSKLWKIARQPL